MAWVSIDETDDEPVRFWSYVLSALRAVAPQVVEDSRLALGVPGLDPVDVELPTLLNDLADSPERLVLVLDDYHLTQGDDDVQRRGQPAAPIRRCRWPGCVPVVSWRSCVPSSCGSAPGRPRHCSRRPAYRLWGMTGCASCSTAPRARSRVCTWLRSR